MAAIIKSVKEKAHEIGWVYSKHYDPIACRQEWCEMAARESANYVLEEVEKQLDEFSNFDDSLIIRRVIEQLKSNQ